MLKRLFSFALLIIPCICPQTLSADWPQFRGPSGQGYSDAQGLPIEFGETQHVSWKTAIPGTGWSSPVVGGRQIWMTTAESDGHSLRAICVDLVSGQIIHNVEVFAIKQPDAINAKNSYASPTPVIDGNRVYVHFGTFGTAAIDTQTGDVLWHNQDLKIEHKEGPGSSPVLWRDLLILTCDGLDAQFVVALEKESGRVRWKTARTGAHNPNLDFRKTYGTPLVIQVDGHDELISTGADRLYAYDPASGQELWWANYSGFSNVPRPLYANGLLFICTGFTRPQLWAVLPGGKGDVTGSHVVWQFKREVPKNASPVIVGDELYMVSDRGILACLEAATGVEVWTQRLGGNYSASPVYADGRIYLSSEEGQVFVLAPGREFKLLATNRLDGRLMASPAVVDNAMLFRTDTHLYRIEKGDKPAVSMR